MDALNGRDMTLGFTAPKDFKQKMQAVKTAMGITGIEKWFLDRIRAQNFKE